MMNTTTTAKKLAKKAKELKRLSEARNDVDELHSEPTIHEPPATEKATRHKKAKKGSAQESAALAELPPLPASALAEPEGAEAEAGDGGGETLAPSSLAPSSLSPRPKGKGKVEASPPAPPTWRAALAAQGIVATTKADQKKAAKKAAKRLEFEDFLKSTKGVAVDNTVMLKSQTKPPGMLLRNAMTMTGKDKGKPSNGLVMELTIPKEEVTKILAVVASHELVTDAAKEDKKTGVHLQKVYSPSVAESIYQHVKTTAPANYTFVRALGPTLKRDDALVFEPKVVKLIVITDMLVKENDTAPYNPIPVGIATAGDLYPIKDSLKDTFPDNFKFRGYMLRDKAVKGWMYVVDTHDANTIDPAEVNGALACLKIKLREMGAKPEIMNASGLVDIDSDTESEDESDGPDDGPDDDDGSDDDDDDDEDDDTDANGAGPSGAGPSGTTA